AMAGPVDVTGAAADFTKLLRAPQGTCSAGDPDYVSLGAEGAYAIVSFGEDRVELAAGDELVIYECGDANDPDAAADTYDVFFGGAASPDDARWSPWVEGATGETRCTVPTLPDPDDPSFRGSCTFSDGVCTQFNGATTRADATTRCADTNNPS